MLSENVSYFNIKSRECSKGTAPLCMNEVTLSGFETQISSEDDDRAPSTKFIPCVIFDLRFNHALHFI